MTQPAEHDLVLVVDFGAQYAQLIARRVREARVYSEIVPHTMPVGEMLARKPEGDHPLRRPVQRLRRGRPRHRPAVFTAGVPVFGMCYGFQLMAQGLGGEVAHTGAREYGRTPVRVSGPAPCSRTSPPSTGCGCPTATRSRRRPRASPSSRPPTDTPVAAFEDVARRLAGVQWHPEVLHSEHGQKVLEHFLHDIAGCRQTWTMLNIVEEQVERIREQIGDAAARSAPCPVASTPPSPPRSCSARSATASPASTSTTA